MTISQSPLQPQLTQQEMEELEKKAKKLEDQQKAKRLYNACNY